MKTTINIILVIVSAVLSSLFVGFTFSTLWGWFIVPSLNMPVIGTLQALGIVYVVRLFTIKLGKKDDRTFKEKYTEALANSFAICIFYLVIGYILALFI
jgi:ABC-type transport system involved in cytochrome bd biosynthesis fused ATPase/permease subunit